MISVRIEAAGGYMERVGSFIVSFIPRYVSSRVLLVVYRILSIFRMPGFIREKHYRENSVRLEQTDWDFWTMPNAYIENQSEWGSIYFGLGKRQSMAYAGCEIMATYNAGKALGAAGSKQDMAELIRSYEKRGAALFGKFGVVPTAIRNYFRENGFSVETADGESVPYQTLQEAVGHISRREPKLIYLIGIADK